MGTTTFYKDEENGAKKIFLLNFRGGEKYFGLGPLLRSRHPKKVPRRHHQTAEARMSKRKNPFGLRSEKAESVEVGLKSSPKKR